MNVQPQSFETYLETELPEIVKAELQAEEIRSAIARADRLSIKRIFSLVREELEKR